MLLLSGAQVLVLGGGFDTTWFQLAQAGRAPAHYLELDYPEVCGGGVGLWGGGQGSAF